MSVGTAKLQEIIDGVHRLLKLRHRETDAKWNGATLPIAFLSKKEAVDVVLKPLDFEHEGEKAHFSVIISSKPTSDWKGAIEFYIFERHLPYVAGWIAEIITLREYRRVNELLLKITLEHKKMAILTSPIEIKQKKQQ